MEKMLGTTLGTWGHSGNLMGTHWEFTRNIMVTHWEPGNSEKKSSLH
jgi:hypothetical protein